MRIFSRSIVDDIQAWDRFVGTSRSFAAGRTESAVKEFGHKLSKSGHGFMVTEGFAAEYTRSFFLLRPI